MRRSGGSTDAPCPRAVCNACHLSYVGKVPILPRPASPKNALADLWAVLSGPLPHKWPLLVLSCVITSLLIWGIYLDSRSPRRPREIIYVESWMANRKDSDVIAQQKRDLARYEAALERKQREFQPLADRFGIDWRADAERNKARRQAIIAAVNKTLDERIAAAKKREAQAAASSAQAR